VKLIRVLPYELDPAQFDGGDTGCAFARFSRGSATVGSCFACHFARCPRGLLRASASGFAIAVTAIMDDLTMGDPLLRSLATLGLEVRNGDKLYYRQIPEVEQAMIFFGRAELWKRANALQPAK
jgi:hypothetical protein